MPEVSPRLFLDFETRSEKDLKIHGLDNYARHPSTSILMLAYAVDNEEVQLWEPHLGPMPAVLRTYLATPRITKVAWNVPFEQNILRHKCDLDIPFNQWIDPQVCARMLSMPGKLEVVGNVLNLPQDLAKDKKGKELKNLFCGPVKLGGEETLFGITETWYHDWITKPKDWAEFCDYCRQDLVSLREITKRLEKFPLPAIEVQGWLLDQKINERGLPVDMDLVRGTTLVAAEEKVRLRVELKALTQVQNPNSNPQILAWVQARGYPFSSLAAPLVKRALAGEGSMKPEAHRALTLRKQTAKTSDSKLDTLAEVVGSDGRLRHQYVYMGAGKTGRWASYHVQLANLPRPTKEVEKNLALALELLKANDRVGLLLEFPNVLEVVSSCLRSMFRAGPGKELLIADLGAIENRMIGWLAKCDSILRVFREGRDPYLDFAALIHNMPYFEIEKKYKSGDPKVKEMRQQAKPAVLGCFAADTPVLTKRGWVPITNITDKDQVFDGENWVQHDGVVYRGYKYTLAFHGIGITPDHLISIGRTWRTAWAVSQNTLYESQAFSSASGLLSGMNICPPDYTTFAGAQAARNLERSTRRISNEAKLSPAFLAQIIKFGQAVVRFISHFPKLGKCSTGGQTGTMQSCLDAVVVNRVGTFATEGVESNADLQTSTNSSGISAPLKDAASPNYNWIASTTTGTMKKGTFDSLLLKSIIATKKLFDSFTGTVKNYLRLNFGRPVVRDIGTREPWDERLGKESPRPRSSPSKKVVAVPTYDILNSGPNHRFVISTDKGPLIVHNCGYRLSGGEEVPNDDGDIIKTGLWGYAAGMGIVMTQADAHKAVEIFRDKYREIVHYWYALEDASFQAIRTGQPQRYGYVKGHQISVPEFRMFGEKLLRITLPSGRGLHYIRPQIELRPFRDSEKETLTYEGVDAKTKQWTRLQTHGGKLLENLSQAVSRDILLNGLLNADARGFDLIGHVHDEIIAEHEIGTKPGLEELIECMTESPAWALDLPLGADGFRSDVYRK